MDNKDLFQGGSLYQSPQGPSTNQTSSFAPPTINPSAPPQVVPPPPPPPPQEEGFLSNLSSNTIVKIVVGIVAMIIVLFLIFGLILPNVGKSKNQKVTLTYWGLWEDSRVMSAVISDFERQNPQITIQYSKQDPKDYRERLITRVRNGGGPDIFRYHNSWYPMLSSVLLPLPDSVVGKQDFNNNYPKVIQADLIKNGAIYGIPLGIDTLSLYINDDIFKSAGVSPPTSWEQFRDSAKSLTVKDEGGKIKTAGAAIGTYGNVNHAPDLISLLSVQNGADPKNITNYNKQVVDALRFYTSFAQGAGSVWNGILDPSILNFSKGGVAMVFGYSWDFFNIKALNPNLNFKVVPVPQLNKNNPTTVASYWVEGASVKSKNQKQVALFLKFFGSRT